MVEHDSAQRGAAATKCSVRDNYAGSRNTAVSRSADRGDFVAQDGLDWDQWPNSLKTTVWNDPLISDCCADFPRQHYTTQSSLASSSSFVRCFFRAA